MHPSCTFIYVVPFQISPQSKLRVFNNLSPPPLTLSGTTVDPDSELAHPLREMFLEASCRMRRPRESRFCKVKDGGEKYGLIAISIVSVTEGGSYFTNAVDWLAVDTQILLWPLAQQKVTTLRIQ